MKRYLVTMGVFCALLALPSQGLTQDVPEKSIWKAASDGDLEAIEGHIAAETDLNEQNTTGYTPLHYGVMKTKPGVVALLLEAGADPNLAPPGEALPDIARRDPIRALLESPGARSAADSPAALQLAEPPDCVFRFAGLFAIEVEWV